MKYKVLIVDDEEFVRDLLWIYVEKLEELEVLDILFSVIVVKKVLS